MAFNFGYKRKGDRASTATAAKGKVRYDSIDNCPMAVFSKIMKTNDYSLLGDHKEPERVWNSIMSEYVDEYGLPDQYKRYLKHKLKACEYNTNAKLKGRRDLETLAEIEERKAALEMMGDGVSESVHVVAARLSKSVGFRINANEVTVREFYAYMKI